MVLMVDRLTQCPLLTNDPPSFSTIDAPLQAYDSLLNIRYELDKGRILADVVRRREKLKVSR